MDEYTEKTLNYFDKKASEYDIKNKFHNTIIALESSVRMLIIYSRKVMGDQITTNELDTLISKIKYGEEIIYYKGYPIRIVSKEDFYKDLGKW